MIKRPSLTLRRVVWALMHRTDCDEPVEAGLIFALLYVRSEPNKPIVATEDELMEDYDRWIEENGEPSVRSVTAWMNRLPDADDEIDETRGTDKVMQWPKKRI